MQHQTAQTHSASVASFRSNTLPARASLKTQGTALSRCSLLLVPDLGGGIDIAWRRRLARMPLAAPADNRRAELDVWAQAIITAALQAPRPVVLLAQGYGSLAAIRAATLQPGLIAGALLLAPANPERYGLEPQLEHATPKLASIMVLGEGPLDLAPVQAWRWSLNWGSQLASIGPAASRGDNRMQTLEQLCRRVLA